LQVSCIIYVLLLCNVVYRILTFIQTAIVIYEGFSESDSASGMQWHLSLNYFAAKSWNWLRWVSSFRNAQKRNGYYWLISVN